MQKDFRKDVMALLLGGASLAALFPGTAVAQDSEPAANESVGQDIVVTGSRVRGEAPVGATVIAVGRAEIENSPALTVDRIIKELPQNFDLGVSENSRAQAGGSGNIVFGNSVNLRGIGPYATLVVVDGHRVVNNSRSTDPSIIPTLGVERVEVVADGASAIYGSDAVAGVVNIIPRRNLDGGEAFARYGVSDSGDFTEYALGAAIGKVWDGGQVMVAYEHVDRSNLSGLDRDFFTSNQTPFGGRDYRVTRCAPGTLKADGTTYAMPDQLDQVGAASLVAGTRNLCDSNAGQDLVPAQSYNTVNATATFHLAPWLEVFADGFYSKRKFVRRSSYSSASITVPETNAFFVRPPGFTGSSYVIDYSFENDLPSNDSFGSAESWQITPGIRLNLGPWRVEGLVGVGKTRDISNSLNGLDNRDLATALANSDPATAFDPYGYGRTNQAVLDAISDQIFIAPTNGDLTAYEARADGPLFALPGGEVKLAAGLERQEFEVALGLARGAPGTEVQFREFGRRVNSAYGELFVPIFGPGNGRPGLERLELNAAVRYDDYSDVGSTTNPKFGINWEPVRGLKLRGSYGTSFRAPTIPEIYGNSNALFGQNYQNPDGGAPIVGFALSGPNLDLKPETAETWSIGADFDMIDRLRLSLTYFSVDYKNQVTANLSNLSILTRQQDYAGTGVILTGVDAQSRVADLLAQGIPNLAIPIPGGDPANVQLFIDGRSQNLGRSITRGMDFAALYSIDLSSADTLSLNLSGTYLFDYQEAVTASAEPVDQLNNIFLPLKFKARGSLTWERGPFTARFAATHVGGYTNNAVTPFEDVDSYTPIDLSLTWKAGDPYAAGFLEKGLSFTVEVRNLFDIDPPYVNLAPGGNGSGGYDATAANPIGRVIAVGVRKSF
ncbi:TonB-dependent receptor [Pelagerythrobacter marensis]|uniref:TonB-dependent receptor n=1 Tax=Pelagerythrobacter marensis TaxID=543877 RepID=A0ABZ2D3B7_9SPHN